MSDFDELFNSIQKSNIVDIIKDSKIELVTEFDANHPLKTGEYFYEEESNTLYVGAGQLMGYSHLSIVDFLTKRVSYKHIPAPRVKVQHLVELPHIIKSASYVPKFAPRVKVIHTINPTSFVTPYAEANKTVLHKYSFNNLIQLPIITHRTEVQNV